MCVEALNDKEFIQAVRNNEYKEWDRGELEKALKDPRRIDAVRQLVTDDDTKACLKLIRSKDSHSLARGLIRNQNHSEQFVKPLSEAIGHWSEQRNVDLVICLYHDIFEHIPSVKFYREEYCELIRNNLDASREALSSFLKTEQDYIRVLGERLHDVFINKGEKTMNHPEKAFTYILYFGLLQDPPARKQARELVQDYMQLAKSTPYFMSREETLIFFLQTCKITLTMLEQ